MDVSPKTLREVEFREKLRGYHPDDVDEFLERVAAGLEILQERLRAALDRAVRAEQKASEVGEGDDAMRRTLVLAQRTADLAVQEAKEQSARIVAGAETQTQELRARAAAQARQTIEDATRDAWVQVRALEGTREDLERDISTLRRFMADERDRVRETLQGVLQHVSEIVPSVGPLPDMTVLDVHRQVERQTEMAQDGASTPVPAAPAAEVDDGFYAELRHAAADAATGPTAGPATATA